MADEIASAIQTVAKTKETNVKLEKVAKDVDILKKEQIKALRVETAQTGESSKGSDGENTGTDNEGNPVVFPDAPPPKPSQNPPQSSSGGDNSTGGSSGGSIGSGYTGTTGTGNSDLSGQGHDEDGSGGGGSLGGSGGFEQATKGDSNTELQTILDAMEQAGYSPEDRLTFATQYTQKKDGYHDVGDVIDGNAGPPPAATQNNSASESPAGNIKNSSQILEGVTGFDPVTNTPMVVNFQKKSYIPSIADATTAGQNPWTNDTTAPVKNTYVEGSYWKIITGFTSLYGQTFDEIVSQRAAFDNSTAYGYEGGSVTGEPVLGEPILFSADPDAEIGSMPGGTVYVFTNTGTVSNSEYGTEMCLGGPGQPEVCNLDAPRETNWPQMGIYLLFREAGKFLGSHFDLDLPNKYKEANPQSSVTLKSYDGREFNIIAGVNGGTIIQPADLTSTSLYYDADGHLTAFVAATQINFYTPR